MSWEKDEFLVRNTSYFVDDVCKGLSTISVVVFNENFEHVEHLISIDHISTFPVYWY